jgi:hypothetical protein
MPMAKAQDQAQAFLRDLLGASPLPANTVRAQAEEAGFAWATIRRAKHQLGVEVVRESVGGTGEGRWLWSLPKEQDAQPQDTQAAQVAQTAQASAPPTQPAQAQAVSTPASPATPPRSREIKVRRPGVVPQGPDEISWEQWQELGCSVERLKGFLRQREAANAPRECSPPQL